MNHADSFSVLLQVTGNWICFFTAWYRNIICQCSVSELKAPQSSHYMTLCFSTRPNKSRSRLSSATCEKWNHTLSFKKHLWQQLTFRAPLPSVDRIWEFIHFAVLEFQTQTKQLWLGRQGKTSEVHGVVFLSPLIACSLRGVISGGKQGWDAVRAAVCSCAV